MTKQWLIVSRPESELQKKPKSTRRSLTKVRTGCIICKSRHIKCDETRPNCNNCLRSRRHCGYGTNSKTTTTGPVQICWDSRQYAQPPAPQMNLPQDVRAADFQDSTCMLYFEGFVDLVRGPWISAVSNVELWQSALPQLARSNDTLRCIAIAIGALGVSHHGDGLIIGPGSPLESDTHYQNAVRYYCRAMKLLSGNNALQDVVSSSILLVFFELLRGNTKTALNHLNHGLSLMLTLLMDETHNYLHAVAPNPKPFLLSLTSIFALLAPQARFVLFGRVGQDRPLPNFIRGLEGNGLTMESFIVMLGQLSGRPRIRSCPATFTNLDEFQECWSALRRRNSAVGPMAVRILQESGALGTIEGDAIDATYYNLLDNPEIKEFCERLREEMAALDKTSRPLFEEIFMSDSQGQSPIYLRALHLRLQFLQVYAFENPPQYVSAEALHRQTPLFKEYLSLARMALNIAKRQVLNQKPNPHQPHNISLECNIAWHILQIAFFCRDPITRMEAVHMLRDYPCQDGLWNVRSLYILALKSQDVERVNALEGTSKEQWERLWRREYVFEDGGERVVFRYQDKHDDTGAWETVEEVAEVGSQALEVESVVWMRRPLTGFGALVLGDLIT
ncbi:Zn(II)2Cys6 transcription factor [Aspergillus stella-maris]|uniref:Zn(II)2Cys6 transcription factor n=1 Tax=Aspergillus stella-maris TaxID=1810926 RepID=UPI003CCE294E